MENNFDNSIINKDGEGNLQNEQEKNKTYTKEEVEALLQSEADKRVKQALDKANKKKQYEIAEAQKLAKMNEEEKFKYELETREKQLAEREKELAVMANKNEASKILAEKGISLSLVDFVVSDEAEDMMERINTLDKAFRDSVKNEVEKRLKGSTPKKDLPLDKSLDKESFKKLSLSEKNKIFTENPSLWKELNN